MNTRAIFITLGVVVLLGLGAFVVLNVAKKPVAPVVPVVSNYTDLIKVDLPVAGANVSSPLVVTGQARGMWYFEASFPVVLLDGNGNQLVAVPAQAQGDWMTTEFVPFKATLAFESPTTATGTLVLKNDNPSGLPENSKEVRIPIVFASYLRTESAEFGKKVRMGGLDKVVFPDGYFVILKDINSSVCKPGMQCVWAGEVSGLFSVGNIASSALPDEVRLGTVNNKSVILKGYRLTVVDSSINTPTLTLVVTKVAPAAGTGSIGGYIHSGPTCPVETNPPNPNCADRPFAGAKVDVVDLRSNAIIIGITSDADGKFNVDLAPGEYVVRTGPGSPGTLPRCSDANVTVTAGKTASADISCDTGIR